jgi:hypothetical protein
MIGKAVYEGILLDVAFAEFFLKKCLGKVNYCKFESNVLESILIINK